MSFAAGVTRLSDPKQESTSPRQLMENQKKISDTMTRLFRNPTNGGNPFLFALSAPKPHQIDKSIPTAATDGKQFYWNPEWLESLDSDQVAIVMMHEAYHVLFYHCSASRSGGLNPRVWNIAVDYVVNSVILTDHEKSGRNAKIPTDKLYQGVLGTPVLLQHYLEWIDGIRDQLPDPGCFSDISQHGRSPESIYEQLQKAFLNSPRRCKENAGGCGALSIDPKTGISKNGPGPYDPGCCPKCGEEPDSSHGYGGSMDSHIPSKQTKDEVLGDMMRAAEQTRAMGRGNVPGDIEEALGLLKEPQLSSRDIIRAALARKKQDAGNINDWKRFRRRPDYIYARDPETGELKPKHRLYVPRKHDFTANVCVMLDTSGSMSNEDMANGIKELQSIAHMAEIHITPNDTAPHWEGTVKVTAKTELTKTKVIGRGGTAFDDYFRGLPTQAWYKGCDVVVIITDGDCGNYDVSLTPPGADVLWIITSGMKGFSPSFGRVAHIRPVHA